MRITEEEVQEVNKNYGFDCRVFGSVKYSTIYINTKIGEWIVEVLGDNTMILKHSNNHRKLHTHIHRNKKDNRPRKFYDLPFLFESLNNHDKFVLGGRNKYVENSQIIS